MVSIRFQALHDAENKANDTGRYLIRNVEKESGLEAHVDAGGGLR
jgi:hypothetical protein